MTVIDLSMPVDAGHFRWPVERGKKGNFEEGSLFAGAHPVDAVLKAQPIVAP